MNNNILNEEKELERGIWFADNPDEEIIEPIIFEEYQFPKYQVPVIETKSERVGESLPNKSGTQMTILGYRTCDDITINFLNRLSDGQYRSYIKHHQTYRNFKKRELKSPYDCTCCGVGYLGVGPYSKTDNKKFYSHWSNMMTRCYNEKSWETRPGHRGCTVHPCFQNFQNFCYWCEKNYYEVEGEIMDLDKDIMHYGNKVYGPTTCMFVPQSINKLFIRDRSAEKICTPVGVHVTDNGRYSVNCNIRKNINYVGTFDDPMEAFRAYKEVKEKEIKRVAEEYKGRIPQLLYDILINYEINPRR